MERDLAPHERTIYVGITDFNNQRFVAKVDIEPLMSPYKDGGGDPPHHEIALAHIRGKVVHSEPIDCEIIHDNNNAKMTVIFLGPVRLDVGRG